MIVSYNKNIINEHVQEVLKSGTEQNDTTINNTLILLDLSADGSFQNRLAPRIVSTLLSEACDLTEIRSIELWISDVVPEHGIGIYAQLLANELLEKGLNISVSAIKKPGYMLLIVPSGADDDCWSIKMLKNTEFDKLIPMLAVTTGTLFPPVEETLYYKFYKEHFHETLFTGTLSELQAFFKKEEYAYHPVPKSEDAAYLNPYLGRS